MLLDKYFGFLRIHDEFSVVESLIEHTRIDLEVITLLQEMTKYMYKKDVIKIESNYNKIHKVYTDSSRIYESILDQIIKSNFDHQKQYDLLRLYQRIEYISAVIMATAEQILIFARINAELPEELYNCLKETGIALYESHGFCTDALKTYLESKKEVINHIHKVLESERYIDHLSSKNLETLYRLGNETDMPQGTALVLLDIIKHFESISDSIESAANSLDWLILN